MTEYTDEQIQANRLAWIEALESGDYVQGTLQLTSVSKGGVQRDCCLGVACKAAITRGLNLVVEVHPEGVHYNGVDDLAPAEIGRYFGMDQFEDGSDKYTVFNVSNGHSANALNDSGRSHADIATYLRELWNL